MDAPSPAERLSSEPDTRQLTADESVRELRRWLASPDAATPISGKLRTRFDQLLDLFEQAAARVPGTKVVSLEQVIGTLFGLAELDQPEPTSNWRKFVQQLRTALEEIQCPIEIGYHKARGPLSDRSVWFTIALSESQRLTDVVEKSGRNLPDSNPRYDPAKFQEQNFSVLTAGRTYPDRIARFLQGNRNADIALNTWPSELKSRLRGLGASLRPILEYHGTSTPRFIGFWLEPTDRAGVWPEAILPSGASKPADAGRWFAAAWLEAALQSVRDLMELARKHQKPGLRFVINFPSGWTLHYEEASAILGLHHELKALIVIASLELTANDVLALRRGFGDEFAVAASGTEITAWFRKAKEITATALSNTLLLHDAQSCQELFETPEDRLKLLVPSAKVPLVLIPGTPDPQKAQWRAWLQNTFSRQWPENSWLVGDSADTSFDELVTLGQQGRGGYVVLPATGPEAELNEVLALIERHGWSWRPLPDSSNALFEIAGCGHTVRLLVNLDGRVETLSTLVAFVGGILVVIGRRITLPRTEEFAAGKSGQSSRENRDLEETEDAYRRLSAKQREMIPEIIHREDVADLKRWLNGIEQVERHGSPYAADSGVQRQEKYQPSVYEDLNFQNAGPALDRLLEWAAGHGPRQSVVLGEYGTGKTFLARIFSDRLQIARRIKSTSGPVPLYVDLRDVPLDRSNIAGTTSQAILRHALQRIRTTDQSDAACQALRDAIGAGLVLLILDGFDEIATLLPLGRERTRLLGEFLALGGRRGRILLTSRNHFFDSQREEDRQFGGRDASDNRDGRGEILRLYLEPFSRDQILRALQSRLGEASAQEAMTFIDQIHNLPELARRPVLLDMIARSLDKLRARAAAGQRVIGATDLYDSFIQEWLDRDVDKSTFNPTEKRLQMAQMAVTLWRSNDDRGMAADKIPSWLQSQFSTLPLADRDLAGCNLRTASFLTRDAEGNYRFAHTSFGEYFLAVGCVEELADQEERALAGPRLSPEVVAFAVSLILARSVTTQRRVAESITDILSRSSEASINAVLILAHWQRTDPHPPTTIRTVRRANLSQLDLTGANLSQLQLEGADLNGTDLTDVNLNQAVLPNVTLDRARLFRTVLRDTRLTGASLNDSRLDQVDATDTDLSRSRADRVELNGGRYVRVNWSEADWKGVTVRSSLALGSNGMLPIWLSNDQSRNAKSSINPPLLTRMSAANCVAFSPDGQHLISGSDDDTLRVWDPHSGLCLSLLKGHKYTVTSVAFSPDGRHLLSGSYDRTLRLWDTRSGLCLHVLDEHGKGVAAVAFSPDGEHLLSGSDDNTLRLWDAQSGICLRILKGHENSVRSVAFSPDGRLLLSGSDDNTLQLWDAQSGLSLRVVDGHEASVNSVAFSPDGRYLLSGSDDYTLRLWNAESGHCIHILKCPESSVNSVAFSPDGRYLLSGSTDDMLRLWDAQSGRCLCVLQGHDHWVRCVTFSPDSRHLLSGSEDNTLRLWDAQSAYCLSILRGHENGALCVALSRDGRHLLSGLDDHTLRLWDAHSGRCLGVLTGHENGVSSVIFSPDGQYLLSGSYDSTIFLWDTQSKRCLRVLQGHEKGISSVDFSLDGRHILSGSYDKTIRIWDVQSGQCLRILKGHESGVSSAVFSPDGRLLLSGSYDKTIRVWDAQSGQCLRILKGDENGVLSVAFSSGGRHLLSGSYDKTIRIWDVQSGQCLRILKGHGNWIRSVAFSLDGCFILSGSYDKTLRLWDAQTGLCLRVLKGHENTVWSVAFSPDGRLLLSGSDDGTLRLWDAQSGNCLRVTTSSGVSIGPDGWPLENGTPPEVMDKVCFPSDDGHSYTARELLEARALGLPLTVTPIDRWVS